MANQSGQVRWFKTTVDDEQQRAVWKHENQRKTPSGEPWQRREQRRRGRVDVLLLPRRCAPRSRVCVYC